MRYFILLLMFACTIFASHNSWRYGSTININSHNKTYYDEINIYADERSEERKEADLLDERIEHYEERFSTDRSTALALIDLSEAKKKSILEIFDNYYKELCPDNILTYAEMDYKTVAMLKEIGFKQNGTNWFFEEKKVNVGKIRTGKINKEEIPDDLYFKASAKITDSNSILITIKTNLKDNHSLAITLNNENDSTQKHTVDSVYVRNGFMEMEAFLPKISKGNYIIDIRHESEIGIENVKLSNEKRACGRFTRKNRLLGRTIIHAKRLNVLNVKKDIFVNNIQTASFRKSEREKPQVSFDRFTDSRDIEIQDTVKTWFGLFTKITTRKISSKKQYKTVKIGDQIWMAENLNYASKESRCYDDLQSNCDKYGRLYPKDESLVVCPDGWHLPSIDEFKTLISTVLDLDKTNSKAGALLRSKTGWTKRKGIDEFGFNVLPAGFFDGDIDPEYQKHLWLGEWASFWSSTSINDWQTEVFVSSGTERSLHDIDYPIGITSNKNFSSIRCIKNQE